MKRFLILLLWIPFIGYSQLTYIPDNNFEAYLENNGMGNGIAYDDSVFTSAIDTLTYLNVSGGAGSATGIFDLTGIEDFISLQILRCSGNQIGNLNLTNNISLVRLFCGGNLLSSLDLSNNSSLIVLRCGNNPLVSLDQSFF